MVSTISIHKLRTKAKIDRWQAWCEAFAVYIEARLKEKNHG